MQEIAETIPFKFESKSGRKVAENFASGVAAGTKIVAGLAKWRHRVQSSTAAYYGESPAGEYVIRLQAGGSRRWVALGTTDLKEAAERARNFFFNVKSEGWSVALLKLHPAPPTKGVDDLTFGDYLAHIKLNHLMDEVTLHGYASKLRTFLAHFFDIEGTGKDKWPKRGQPSAWHAKLHAIELSRVTPAEVSAFMHRYIANRLEELELTSETPPDSAARDLEALRAKHTINALIRSCQSLFSRKMILSRFTIPLPKKLPFEGVRMLREAHGEFRFVREVDPTWLLDRAVAEIAPVSPAQFVIFLLCLGTGLRRNEVDKLCWRDIDFCLCTAEVARSQFQKGKSEASLRKIKLPLPFADALRSFRGDALDGEFVIPSAARPRVNVKYHAYRCTQDFRELCAWLRTKGIKREVKPLHSLRKYFGDVICSKYGIYAAAKALGHQKVSTTERHYAAPPEVDPAPFSLRMGNPFARSA